uniref:Single stranded DNA binding protein 4 n=1 Tax=Coturnix japonica TaxID=93934 RepID=A0A8C2TKP4_COTJA
MYGKGKGCAVPSDGQAREKLALYVYEYLLHVGAQKSAQTFLSEIRWEKNITLGEPPGFLHSWWCVFWDLYCAAPDRRETCEHSSEAKAFHDYSAAAAPSPVMGNLPPSDGMAGGPMAPGFFQPPTLGGPPVGVPGSQPLLPNAMDPAARAQGHPNMGGPMQRMNPPRGMGGMAPQVRGGRGWGAGGIGGGRRLWGEMGMGDRDGEGSGMGTGRWRGGRIAYSSSSPGNYVGPPGGGGPPGTPIMPSPGDSTNSSENMYTMMNPIGPAGTRPNVSDDMGGCWGGPPTLSPCAHSPFVCSSQWGRGRRGPWVAWVAWSPIT